MTMRILLAEDDELNQKLGIRLLESSGHHVTLASDGEEACGRFLASPHAFDLILMDLQMPRIGGLEAARRVRRIEREQGGRVPILALTADPDPQRLQSCLVAGMDGVVGKPLDVAAIESAVERITRGEQVQPVATANSVLGWEAALELVLGDEALLRDMANLFLERADDRLADIADAHMREDAEALARAAHKLKGSAGNFGAQGVMDAAERIERAAEAGEPAAVAALLPALRAALEQACAELRARVEAPSP